MEVQATSGTTSSSALSAAGGDLGKDQFFKLLMAQLTNQDPLKPMDDAQFIGQLAQFSTLEKMQEMDDRMGLLLGAEQLGQAQGLIGREIESKPNAAGETTKGIVESAKIVDGTTMIVVGGNSLKLSDVASVIRSEQTELAQASGLIKMEVEARVASTGQTVKGIVDSVTMENGAVILKIGGQAVKLGDVVTVSEGDRTL